MKFLHLTLIFSICCSLFAQLPADGLVGFYPFNNSTIDSSTFHNDAFAGGCSFTIDRFGNENAALEMNGISDSLIIPIPELAPLPSDFTISFWMKTNSPEKLNLFSLKESPNDTINNFEIQFSSTSSLQSILEIYYGFYTYWNGSGWVDNYLAEGAAGTWYDGRWHHHVLTRTNDTLSVWHEGLNYTSVYYEHYAGPIGDALNFVVSAAPNKLKGTVDDIAFYNRALSETEIQNLFHDHNPYNFIDPKSTDAYFEGDTILVRWDFDATQVSDSIDLEYRINETGDWMLTDQNHLVEYFFYPFIMNYPIGTKVELRITDKLNATNTKTVGPFIVSEYQWQLVNNSLPFTPRDGSGLINFQNKMWLFGGWDPPFHEPYYTCSEIYSSTDGINWEYHGEAPWPPRHISGWLVHENAIYLIGGDPQSGALSDVWKSDDGINWIQLLDSIPYFLPHRNSINTASVNHTLLNFGGQQVDYTPGGLNQVWRSTDGIDWEQLPDAPWTGRGMILNNCVDTINNVAWMLGGGRLWDRRCYNEVWNTADGESWNLVNANPPWQARYWHTVAWFDNKMWVMNGIVNQTDNDETWYSADGITWYELKYPKYLPRHAHSTTVYDNALWMMAGIGTNDCWKLVNTNPPIVEQIQNQEFIFNVFPNPANALLQIIISPDVEIKSIRTYNYLNQLVQVNFKNYQADISHLTAGVYFTEIISESGRWVQQWVKL